MAEIWKVITNNVPRDVIDGFELTEKEREEFDYLDWKAIEEGSDSASFFRYKGEIYDLGEFEVWNHPQSPLGNGWHGFRSDTFFSGILVKYVGDCEQVIVARCYS